MTFTSFYSSPSIVVASLRKVNNWMLALPMICYILTAWGPKVHSLAAGEGRKEGRRERRKERSKEGRMAGRKEKDNTTNRKTSILESVISKECVMLSPSTHYKTYTFLKTFKLLGIIFDSQKLNILTHFTRVNVKYICFYMCIGTYIPTIYI